MLTEKKAIERDTLEIMCTEMLVPKDHLLRKIDAAVDFKRIYEIVGDLYCREPARQRGVRRHLRAGHETLSRNQCCHAGRRIQNAMDLQANPRGQANSIDAVQASDDQAWESRMVEICV